VQTTAAIPETTEYLRHDMNRTLRYDEGTEPNLWYALSLQALLFYCISDRDYIVIVQSHSVMALEGPTSLHRYAGYVDHLNQEFGVAKKREPHLYVTRCSCFHHSPNSLRNQDSLCHGCDPV
jgi:hypothetical protein